MSRPVYRDGLVHVAAQQCATCIFRSGNVMHLTPGRLAGMIRDAAIEGGSITCHETLDGDQAVCRGWFDRHADASLTFRLAHAFGVLTYVDPTP